MDLVYLNQQTEALPPNFAEIIHMIRDSVGVDHVSYIGQIPGHESVYGYSTYSEEWVAEFRAKNYHNTSPTIVKAAEMVSPLDWSMIRSDPSYKAVFESAAAHDVPQNGMPRSGMPRNGMTIPARGPHGDFGVMTFSKNCTDAEWVRTVASKAGDLMIHAIQFHDSVLRHVFGEDVLINNEAPALGELETEALIALSEGSGISDISARLNTSKRTCESILHLARLKLCAVSNPHAVIRALEFGLIPERPAG